MDTARIVSSLCAKIAVKLYTIKEQEGDIFLTRKSLSNKDIATLYWQNLIQKYPRKTSNSHKFFPPKMKTMRSKGS